MPKASLTLLLACALAANCFAQGKPLKIFGTVRIDSATLMEETEVSLKEWMGFIVNNNFDESLYPDSTCIASSTKLVFNDLRRKKDFQYLKVTKNWLKYFGDKEVETAKDFNKLAETDPNYFSLKLPVTGITYEQAQKFCKWKEDVINQNQKDKITVSLPSIEIYKKVITNIDTLSKNCKCLVLNCSTARDKTGGKDKQSATQGKGLESVISYFPTSLGLYGLQGNAAEMTSTFGIAMGGSFRQTARESYNDRSQKYNKAEGWLGFRYIIITK